MALTVEELERDYMTVYEIADQFQTSSMTVNRWRKAGAFDPSLVEIHLGRYYVHRSAVAAWRGRYGTEKPVKGRRLPLPA